MIALIRGLVVALCYITMQGFLPLWRSLKMPSKKVTVTKQPNTPYKYIPGTYSSLPQVSAIDFSLLTDQVTLVLLIINVK